MSPAGSCRRAAQGWSDALRQAEALARRLPGAAAFGDVPDDVIDGLAGG